MVSYEVLGPALLIKTRVSAILSELLLCGYACWQPATICSTLEPAVTESTIYVLTPLLLEVLASPGRGLTQPQGARNTR